MLRQILFGVAVAVLFNQAAFANPRGCFAENPKGDLIIRDRTITVNRISKQHTVRITGVVRSSRPDIKAYRTWSKAGGVGYLFLRRFDCPESHPGTKEASGFVLMDKTLLWSGCCDPWSGD